MNVVHHKNALFKRLSSLITSLSIILTSTMFNWVAAEESVSAQPTVFASVTVSGTDDLWLCAEEIATVMKYREIVQVGRSLVKSRLNFDLIDSSQPFGIVLATDGSSIIGFGRLPLKNGASVDNAKLETIKTFLETIDKGNLFKVDFFVVDNSLVIGQISQKDLIAAIPVESHQTIRQKEDSHPLLEIDLNLEAIPSELLEAGASLIRQKLSEEIADESPEKIQTLEQALSRYNDVLLSVARLKYALVVDTNVNILSQLQVILKPNSKIALTTEKSFNKPTRWNVVTNIPNPIVSVVQASDSTDLVSKSELECNRQALHHSILDSLNVLIDDPNNLEIAKEIALHLEEAIIADEQTGMKDSAFAVSSTPLLFVGASSTVASESLKKATNLSIERLQNEFPSFKDSFTKETIEGYEVFAFNYSSTQTIDGIPSSLANKGIAIKIGFSDDAAVFVAGLDEMAVTEEFLRIAVGNQELEKQPHASTLDVVQIARAFQEILKSVDDVRPNVLKSVDLMANAEEATIISTENYSNNLLTFETTVSNGLISALGDIIRLSLIKSGTGNEGQDLDDLFEDEE